MTEQTFRSNCIFWAIGQWAKQGGYIAARRSHHWRFIPHVLHSTDLKTWRGFAPINPKKGWRVALDCLWFVGAVTEEKDE